MGHNPLRLQGIHDYVCIWGVGKVDAESNIYLLE